jgi:hypothetical protein
MKRFAAALAAMTLAITTLGCQTMPFGRAPATQPKVADLPPVPDRLRSFYQELQAGRFEIIADLEQPAQAQIFRVDGAGASQLTVRRSRLATGAGALEVRLDDPAAALLVDDRQAKEWALPRDWSRYQLLMASIHVPAPVAAHLQVGSGTDQPAVWDAPPLPLQKGWNLVRIDLADVARQANIADVRQIRMTVKAAAWPFTFYLDDLILADNTATVYGDPEGGEGDLYVLKKGRRFHVGAARRFELVFAHGMLAGWHDLSDGADKTVDLAGTGPAGPALTALDDTGAPLGAVGIESWAPLGKSVQTHLQVIETNTLCVTGTGTIRRAEGAADSVETPTAQTASPPRAAAPAGSQPTGAQAAGDLLEQTYLYTIRRDGRVFIDIQAHVSSQRFAPAGVGLAVTNLHSAFEARPIDPLDRLLLSGRGGASAPADVEPAQAMAPADAAGNPIPRALLLARPHGNGTSLLLVPSNVGLCQRLVSAVRPTGDVAAHVYVLGKPMPDRVHLAAMLALWPPDLRDPPTAAAIARDYQEPTPPTVEVGRLRTDADGDLDGDGFAEGLGRWTVQPDTQILRLRWPAGHLRFWPMLEVTGTQGKACWPYLDGRIIKPVEKRPNGNAIFVVPEILSRAALLEVTIEK